MKRLVSVVLAVMMLTFCLPASFAVTADDYDPVGDSLADTVSPYLEEGGFESEDYFLTLDDFAAHKITFINIWSNGCGPCISEMPYFQQVHEEYADRGVLIVGGVTTWINGNFAQEYEYLQSHGYTYMNVVPDNTLRKLYQKNGYVPQTFIVNSEGTVIDFIGGGTNYATLVSKIDYWTGIMDSGVEYEVNFIDGVTNEVIETQMVVAGHSPIYPEPPEHPGYSFQNWTPAKLGAITANTTITANYKAEPFRVRFFDSIDGTKLSTQYIIYGHAANPPEAPEHPGYEFVGWDADYSFITAAIDIYTVYQPTGAQPGDVDGDNSLTANDALMILRHALGVSTLAPGMVALADVDGDGNVTANDALTVLRMALGITG